MRTSVFKPRFVYIYDVAKSLEFCFRTKKEKTKPKDFAYRVPGNPSDFRPSLIIAKPLAII